MSEKVRDPVCGMPVDTAHAAASTAIGDEVFYFCSASCQRAFLASRQKERPASAWPGNAATH